MKPTARLRSYLIIAGSSLFAVSSLPAATFYWDSTPTPADPGFGTAAGTWAQNATSGNGRWTTSATGILAGSPTQTTANTDVFNFGTGADGLGAGTITVSGSVTMGNTTFGSASGAIVLSGGTINYAASSTITVNNASNTINSVLGNTMTTTFTKAGGGILILGGTNTYTAATSITGGTLRAGAAAGGQAFGVNSAVTLSNTAGVTLDLNGFSQTIGSLAGGGATGGDVTLGSGSAVLTIGGNNTSTSFAGVISGTGTSGLTKNGTSTQTLTGANTFAGTTTINNGSIDLGGGTANGSLSSATLTLAGGSFSYTRTGTNTQSFTTTNFNSSASGITVSGGNTLNLGTVTRANGLRLFDFSATGAGTVAADTASNANGIMPGFTVGDSWAVANGPGVAISALAGGSYTLTSVAGTTGANYTNANIEVDNSAGLLDAAITANSLRFSAAAANTVTLAAGTNTISSGGILVNSSVGANLSTITGGTLTGAASKDLAIIQNNTSGGLTISSVIANNTSTSLTKSGAGLLTLNASNTFTGGLTIYGGRVLLNNAGALNSTAGSENAVTFGPGATGSLALNGNSLVLRSLATNTTTPGSALVENASGTNATLTIGNTGNASGTFAGVIQDGTGGGTLALSKAGTGTLTLSGANTYTGDTTISAGVVNISNATSFGAGDVSITGTSRINTTQGNGVNVAFANNIDVGGALTLQNPQSATGATSTFSGQLTGSNSITLVGGGGNGLKAEFAFTNTNNTWTGDVIMPVGNIVGYDQFSFNSIGDGGKFTLQKSGNQCMIAYTGSSNITFATRLINIGALSGTFDGGGTNPVNMFANNGAGTVTFNTNMTVGALANLNSTLFFGGSNAGNNTFGGIIPNNSSGAGSFGIGKTGTGKWILTGSNSYAGEVLIRNGTLSVNAIDVVANNQPLGKNAVIQIGHHSNTGTLEFTGGTNSTTDKQIRVGNTTAAQAGGGIILNNGAGSLTFSNPAFNVGITGVTTTRTLTLSGTNTGDNTISGVIQDNVASTGKVALTKSDSGTWVLGGVNTYSGNTTLSNTGGTLKLDYSTLPRNNSKLSDTGTLTLGTGTTLELIGGTHTEIVASTTLSSNSALPASVSQTGGSSVLQMGAITRNTGAYISFSGSGIATTNTLNNSLGILGTWATVNNGNDWAVNSTNAANGLITAPVYTDVARLGGSQVIADASASQVRIIEGAGSAADITLGAATTTIATLTQSTTGGASVSVIDPAGQTLAVGAILAQNGAGSLTIGNGTNNGNIQALSAGGELVVNTVGTSNVTINSVILDNTNSTLTKIGTGTLTLSGTNTYAGGTTIINNGGTLRITNAAALGTGAVTISTAGTNTGTLELALAGTNSITTTFNGFSSANGLTNAAPGVAQILNTSGDNTITSNLTITGTGGNGLNVASNGGLLTLAGTITHAITSGRTLSLGGSGDGVVSGPINNNGSNSLAVIKSGSGTWTLSNATSTYAGNTTISGGTLAMGANDVLPTASAVSIGAGTLDAATYTDTTTGTLDVTAAATINLGAGATLAFANSSGVDWTGGTLNITGTFVSGSSIRLGTTNGGLTPTQLGLITVNGSGPVSIDGSGYLTTSAVSGFAAWQSSNSTAGGRDQDHDGDGVDNGTEHFLGGTANTTGFTSLPSVVNTAGILSVTWTKAGTYTGTYGTDFTVETSATLSGPWTPESVVPTPGANVTITGNDVKYTFPGGPAYSGKKFARLKVTGP